MAFMPVPAGVPKAVWDLAENKEMEQIIALYGKTYHFWQIDRGDELPLGQPQLMMSFTEETKPPNWKNLLKQRDEKFHVDTQAKIDQRKYIKEPQIHPGMDRLFFVLENEVFARNHGSMLTYIWLCGQMRIISF